MKHYLITFTLGMTIVFAKTFTITDPPMVYIYHFVSYDTTDVVFHVEYRMRVKIKNSDFLYLIN